MTPHHDSTGIAALDELGLRLEAVAERRGRRRLRPRRWMVLSFGVLALVATPAIASVSGLFDGPPRVEDVLPQAAAAIDRDDPAATGRALEQRGFRVQWVLITDNPDRGRDGESPTRQASVAAPPAGTKILSVLGKGGTTDIDARTRDLQIEVSPVGSAILKTHP